MHAKPKHLLNPHRRARLIAWTLAMLAWVQAVIFGGHVMSTRQLRKRGRFLSLDAIANRVARLIVIRAVELVGAHALRFRRLRNRGADLRRGQLARSLIGSRLRRALKHRAVGQRIAILIGALNALDLWAARFAARVRRRLTKLWAIVTRPCAAEALAAGAATPLSVADTS